MGRQIKVRDEKIIEALEACGGVILHAAAMIGMNRKQMSIRIKAKPEMTERLMDIRESNIDIAESKLMELIRKGQPSAIIFFLKCLAKDRGYVERVEQTGKDGKDLILPVLAPPRANDMDEWLEQNKKEAAAA